MCRSRTVALVALLSSATLAMVLAAQTSLACTDKVAVPMTGDMMQAMPGMDMASMNGPVMVCPVVLGLIILSALLTACAWVMFRRDPHRALAQHETLNTLARLPLARTAAFVALAGTAGVGVMICVERNGLPALPICAMLAALLFGCALAATLLAIAAGRIAIAFGRRLILAIVAAVASARRPAPPRLQDVVAVVAARHAVPLLAAGRGLRAPPSFVH